MLHVGTGMSHMPIPLSRDMQDEEQHELDSQTLMLQESTLAADQDLEQLTAGLGEDFTCLKREFDSLLGSLSNSVHDATQLTLEHTTLYDSAVGELQVACHFMPLLRCIPVWICTPCMYLASTHSSFTCIIISWCCMQSSTKQAGQ